MTPKFKLFSLSRPWTATSKKEKPPPVITAPARPLWQADFDDGGQSFHSHEVFSLATAEQYTPTPRVRTAPATLARPPPTTDPRSQPEPHIPIRDAPVFTPFLQTPIGTESQRRSPFVVLDLEPRLVVSDWDDGRHDAAAKTPQYTSSGRNSPRPPGLPLTARQRGRVATPDPRRIFDTKFVKDSPARDEGVDLEEYPWYLCRNVEGREVRQHLTGQRMVPGETGLK